MLACLLTYLLTDTYIAADRNPRSLANFLKNFAFHLSETHIESPKTFQRGLSFRGVLRFAEAKRKLYRPFSTFSFFTSLRSLRQLAAPHLAGARHSATAKTLHTRADAGCTKAASLGYALQLEQVESIAPVWQTTFRVRETHLWSGVL